MSVSYGPHVARPDHPNERAEFMIMSTTIRQAIRDARVVHSALHAEHKRVTEAATSPLASDPSWLALGAACTAASTLLDTLYVAMAVIAND